MENNHTIKLLQIFLEIFINSVRKQYEIISLYPLGYQEPFFKGAVRIFDGPAKKYYLETLFPQIKALMTVIMREKESKELDDAITEKINTFLSNPDLEINAEQIIQDIMVELNFSKTPED